MLHPTDHQLLGVSGLLQPSSHGGFKLVSPGHSYSLKVPKEMEACLHRHLWEKFEVLGLPAGDHIIEVKRCKQCEEDLEAVDDVDSFQDLDLYQHQIHQGFYLESRGY